MELYKRERINPLSGCLPMAIQVPVLRALQGAVRHHRNAPPLHRLDRRSLCAGSTIFSRCSGSIQWVLAADLPGPRRTAVDHGCDHVRADAANPAPPDPGPGLDLRWMPIMFTFMLASLAGLVIDSAWNNTLSEFQQAFIMKKNGVKIELWDNPKSIFTRKKKTAESTLKADKR